MVYIRLVWICANLGSLLTVFFPKLLRIIATHGKFSFIKTNDNIQYKQYFLLDKLFVPKSLFKHFYIIGIIVNIYCISCVYYDSFPNLLNVKAEKYAILLMFLFHVSRRYYECLYITSYGDSKIHIIGYLVGIIHYIAVPITLRDSFGSLQYSNLSINYFLWQTIVVIIFFIANFLQYKFHKELFLLKANNNKINKDYRYSLPKGLGFTLVSCPHYTAEITIYLSFWLLKMTSLDIMLLNVWVVSNLSIVANLQYIWYKKEFKTDIKPNWKRLVPYVW